MNHAQLGHKRSNSKTSNMSSVGTYSECNSRSYHFYFVYSLCAPDIRKLEICQQLVQVWPEFFQVTNLEQWFFLEWIWDYIIVYIVYYRHSIRCLGSDAYLGMSPIQHGGSYLMYLRTGKSTETVANWNNWGPYICLFQGAKCDNVPKGSLECA